MAPMETASAEEDLGLRWAQEADDASSLDALDESAEAPDEPPEAPAAPGDEEEHDQDVLMEALAEFGVDELQEMCRRFVKCHACLTGMHEDLEAEHSALREENAGVHQSIALAMVAVRQSGVLLETAAPDGELALGAVGRLWESVRLKPGDTAAVLEAGQQAAQRLQDAWGPLRLNVAGYWNNVLGGAGAVGEPAPHKSTGHRADRAERTARRKQREKQAQGGEAPYQAEAEAEVALAEAASETARAPSRRIPVSANPIIIEAEVTTADKRSHTLQVRVAESIDCAAKRFVHEHTQRAWFEEPLAMWLKDAEAEAAKLPVEIQGDLVEIRKQYSKRTSSCD